MIRRRLRFARISQNALRCKFAASSCRGSMAIPSFTKFIEVKALNISKAAYSTASLVNSDVRNTWDTKNNTGSSTVEQISETVFHRVGDAALEGIQDLLQSLEDEEIISSDPSCGAVEDVDLTLSQGVLTICIQLSDGTSKVWVINKQTPNRQLWWSSPISGPRRYEYVPRENVNRVGGDDVDQLLDWRYLKQQDTQNVDMNDRSNTLLQHLHEEMLSVTGVDLSLATNKY